MNGLDSLRSLVEQRLSTLVSEAEPGDLYDPVRYVLAGGGKRLRPIIVMLAARGFDVSDDDAIPAALAVEVFHNFTLVHDDIMDHSDERRGRPTVHRKWNEDVAILAGDYMMGLSYKLLSHSPPEVLPELMEVFSEMVRQLCEGQTMDKAFESRRDVTVDEYFGMIDAKTGALLRTCLELGAVLGGGTDVERSALREAGTYVGRAFQMQDDLLDVIAEDERWGKAVGGDLIEGKRTYLLLRCLEKLEGEHRDWFQRIIDNHGLDEHLVAEAQQRMRDAGVIADAVAEIERFTGLASKHLESLSGRSLEPLVRLFRKMMARRH